jgi:transcriptional regulator with XRE-family HTH domain
VNDPTNRTQAERPGRAASRSGKKLGEDPGKDQVEGKDKPPTIARRRAAPGQGMRVTLGHQVRDLRRAKGMTIPQLAARIERSVGWLSQVERGLSEVSISTLDQIARALEVQVSWFFSGAGDTEPGEQDLVVRRGRRRTLDFQGSGVHEEMLSPNLGGQLLLVETTFAPGASTGERDRERHGEEAGLVLQGRLELRIDGRVLLLEAGDSFTFTRKGPHRCHNPGSVPTVVLWVITPPSY